MEDAEQHERLGGEVVVEPARLEPECEGDAAQHALADRRDRVDVLEHCVAETGGPRREQVRTVQRPVARWELLTEVQPFFLVGLPGRQLAADGEPAPPRVATARHRDRSLLFVVEREELARERVEAGHELAVDAVPDEEEEPRGAAGPIEVGRHGLFAAAQIDQRK